MKDKMESSAIATRPNMHRINFWNKAKEHFFRLKNYYIVSGIILIILLTLALALQIFPFGNKTLATGDTLAQIVPFLGLIIDAMEGKSTLIFSNYIAGGANIVGYISYFIFSPFYLLVLPFGKENIVYSLNIAYFIQFICIGVVFLWFIRKYFKLNDLCQIILALLYTFSPYVFSNYSWFSWLFLYMLLPIVVHQFLKMLKGSKIWGFALSVTAMIYNCYGVGLMGQILIFTLGTIFIFTVIKDKEKRKSSMVNMLISYAIAILLSLPFLSINAMQLLDSSRVGLSSEIISKPLFKNIPYAINFIISDVISLLLGIIYLCKCKKKNRFNQFLIITILLNAIPLLIDGIYLILSMGSYYGFGMRMGYLLSFFMVLILACYLKDFCRKHEQQKTVIHILHSEFPLLFLLTLLIVIIATILIYVIIKNMEKTNPTTNAYLISIVGIPLLSSLIYLLLKKKNMSKKLFLACLLIIAITQSTSNSTLSLALNSGSIDNLEYLAKQSQNLDIDYDCRIKDAQDIIVSNLHLLTGFSQFSGFASQINENSLNISSALGYYTAGAFNSQVHENSSYTYGGTVLSDSFLAMDYVIYSEEVNYPWLEIVDTKTFINGSQIYLYKNTLSLNNAILIDKDASLDLNGDLLKNTNSLFNYLGGDGEIMRAVTLSQIANSNDTNSICSLSQENGEAVVTFNKTAYSKVMYISGKPDKLNTVNITNDFHNGLYLFDDTLVTIDYFEKNTQGTLTIKDYKTSELDRIVIYELNYDILLDLINSLKEQEVEFNYTASGFNAKVNATEQKMVVTNVNIDGYKAVINGKKTALNKCGFVELNLSSGENNIIVTYHFPYTKTLIISLAISIVGLVTLLLIRKYLHKLPKIKSLIYYGGMILFVIFLAVVYFIPSAIFVGRICLLKF